NTPDRQPSRLKVSRRCKKNVARGNHHHAAARRFHRDWNRVGRQFEGAHVALVTPFRSQANLLYERYTPQRGGTLDVGRESPARHVWRRLVLLLVDEAVLCADGRVLLARAGRGLPLPGGAGCLTITMPSLRIRFRSAVAVIFKMPI